MAGCFSQIIFLSCSSCYSPVIIDPDSFRGRVGKGSFEGEVGVKHLFGKDGCFSIYRNLANGFTLEVRFKCFTLTPQAIISIRGDHNSMFGAKHLFGNVCIFAKLDGVNVIILPIKYICFALTPQAIISIQSNNNSSGCSLLYIPVLDCFCLTGFEKSARVKHEVGRFGTPVP
jgi:hypothetical protein